MAARVFVIEEQGGENATFKWTADSDPPDPLAGGRRAAPLNILPIGGQQRTVRTDYPGATDPSEQVLGPAFKPMTFTSEWDDRYNFEGYAVKEMRQFEAMCRRGNPVWITFEEQGFSGVIVDWSFEYRRESKIKYQFEFSVHRRRDEAPIRIQSTAQGPMSVAQGFDQIDLNTQELIEAHKKFPTGSIAGDLSARMDVALVALNDTRNAMSTSVDGGDIAPSLQPIDQFRRLASQAREVQGSAFALSDELISVRSDIEVGVRTAMSVLDFEDWSRSLRERARLIVGISRQSADDLDERADPRAKALYRPHKGESLYQISARYYGTPHEWRLLADVNGLESSELTGDELLMIPERGQG